MSRSTTEADIENVIDYLEDIENASRVNDSEKIAKLAKDAYVFARKLKSAKDEVHRHWEKG